MFKYYKSKQSSGLFPSSFMAFMSEELLYQIGLTLIDGIGDVNAKALLAYCGSASGIFEEKETKLKKIPGIGDRLAKQVSSSKDVLSRAEEEVAFIKKYRIKPLFFTDPGYPRRLKSCSDSPILLYYKGCADLNTEKVVAIVGTRKPSEYGKSVTQQLVKDLSSSGVLILSGLAYGVDIWAHKSALDCGLNTVGVVGHGLDRIYPQLHEKIAKQMIGQGGLLTDFMSGTNPDAVNFPKRNRIVAGLCDALVVVESKRTGGSLITATIANSYNRDVFAFPGPAGESLSEGCNGLIKRNRAGLIESAEDLLEAMGWQEKEKPKKNGGQLPLAIHLNEEEKLIMAVFAHKRANHIEEICLSTQMPVSKISALLFQMEFNNLIKSLPGKMYELI